MAKEMRGIYQETVIELMKNDSRVVMLDADLASASGSTKTFKEFPKQTINCGIAEANMISAACGMSLTGCIPFIHTFAPFATRRVYDQLYVSGAFSQNKIHVYGSEPGVWAQFNGGTHTSFEDLAMMRALPNAVVCAPCDEHQFKFILESYYEDDKLYYTRSPRTSIGELYSEEYKFELGKWIEHGEGKDGCIITYGSSIYDAFEAKEILKEENIDLTIIDAYSIYPYDKEMIRKLANKFKHIMVLENHSIYGGMGELVGREMSLIKHDAQLHHIGINHHVSEVGNVKFLKEKFGIDTKSVVNAWKNIVK